MKYPTRIYCSETDKAEMWDRWQKGESLNAIARQFGTSHSSIQGVFAPTGGIRPPPRCRSRQALSLAEREEISHSVAAGRSLRCIDTSLARAPWTISREIRRNGGPQRYRANKAEQAAWDRAHGAKTDNLAENPALALIVAEKLQLEWSPNQIAAWLKSTYPDDEHNQVSHETIYKTRFIRARGVLKKSLYSTLGSHGRCADPVITRRRRRTTAGPVTQYRFGNVRPRLRIAPYRVTGKLTWDRGKKMADHERFGLDTDIKVSFCDPQSPWQRGSNENTNSLLRPYFRKAMDLSNVHYNRLNAVARRLNERPRKTLEYRAPAERFAQCAASTA